MPCSPPKHQRLLRHLSVFVGGWTRESAAAVSGDPPERLTAGLRQLTQSHLILPTQTAAGPRYRMLETIREFGLERLTEAEGAAARGRHAQHFAALCRATAPELKRPGRPAALEQLEAERANLRLAFESGPCDLRGELVGDLWWFWRFRGGMNAGRLWAEEALADPIETRIPARRARGKALWASGMTGWIQGDIPSARERLMEAVRLWTSMREPEWLALSLMALGVVARFFPPGPQAGHGCFRRSAAILRETGNKWDLAVCLALWGQAMTNGSEVELVGARPFLEESVTLGEELNDPWLISFALLGRARFFWLVRDSERARSDLERALAAADQEGDAWSQVQGHAVLGEVVQRSGDLGRAWTLFTRCLPHFRVLDDDPTLATTLHNLGWVCQEQGRLQDAVRLFAAAARVWDFSHPGPYFSYIKPERRAQQIPAARAALGEEAFAAAWSAGQAMTLDQVIAFCADTT